MKKVDHRAIITTGRGALDGPLTAGRSYGNGGSADDIFNLRITRNSDAITLSPLQDLSNLSERIGRMYSERGGALVYKRKRPARNSSKQTEQQSEEAALSVPALFVVPIPSPMGELNPVITAYRHELGEAGGQSLIWRGIGNPGQQDGIFKVQMDSPMSSSRAQKIEAFLKGVAEDTSEPDFIKGEYYKLARNLGIPPRDLPAILFVAPYPVYALAVLYLDVGMFEGDSRKQALALHLLESITQNQIAGLAPGGEFTRLTMRRVQDYLDIVANDLRNMTIDDTPTAAVLGDDVEGAAFAYLCGSDRKLTELSADQYRRLRIQHGRYDVIIDGIEGKCFKPRECTAKYREEQLEPAESKMLSDYIIKRQPMVPSRAGGRHSGPETALRTLQKARKKLESTNGQKGDSWFRQLPNGWEGPSCFLFAPPSGKRWLLIALKPETRKKEGKAE